MSILVDADTTFIIQGITGREAVTMARECLDYGAKLLGGVTPGRKGREVHGLPVMDTVRQFTDAQRVDASVVSVPSAAAVVAGAAAPAEPRPPSSTLTPQTAPATRSRRTRSATRRRRR